MLVRAHFVLLLGFLLFSPLSYAAGTMLPASSSSPTSAASDKTVYLEAQVVEGEKDAQIEARGNVEMQQGTQKVFADHMIYEQKTGDLFANGSVRVEQPTGSATGPEFKMNTNTHVSEMTTPVFEIKQDQKIAHGDALSMHSTGPTYYVYDHATYTTCPAGNDDWLLHMSEFDMDRAIQIGTAHNAWIDFQGVPILYTPWMSFPLDGARHTGLLAPVLGSTSTGGMELTVPFYWNIAPNFDYTIAPRDMSKRGILVKNEFRFMEPGSYGEINLDKMPNDHLTGISRQHTSVMVTERLGGGFGATLNLNRVSDDNYFRDLSVMPGEVAQTQLLNEGALSYSGGWLSGSIRGQTFQTLQDPLGGVAIPYQRMPQINLSAQKTLNDTALSLPIEYVDFRHPTTVDAQRLALYPSVSYTLLNDPGFYMKPKFGINYTQYEFGDNNSSNIPNTTRTLPIFSLDSGMTFERDMKLGEGEYVQTLEPRIYYVKIPYQNQDAIPLFDTTQAALSFPQMFSENRFYGNDRIGDANMVTTGLTTRLIDGVGGIERLNIGVAERYSLSMPQIAPDANLKSDILLSIGGKVTNTVTLSSLFDYDPNQKYTTSGNITAAYKPEIGKLLNLGYTFTQNLVTPTSDSRQADFSTQWPLFWHWNAVSRLSYDLQQNVMTVKLIGLEYNQSCWTVRLITEQFWYSVTSTTNAMLIQLELNDLVAVGNSNPLGDLKFYIPGYIKLNDPKLNPVSAPGTVSP